MFCLTKPTTVEIEVFLENASSTHLSYTYIGSTRKGFGHRPEIGEMMKYVIDHNQIVIGHGAEDFQTAKQAVREWKMFDMPWANLCWPNTPIKEDRTVAILIHHFGFYSLNAARIVYTIDERDRFGFAYGTLEDHRERGEERFSVIFNGETGDVSYDIFAFSRPNHLLAQLGYPLTRMLQKRFAADSMQAMLRAVQDNRIN